MVRKTAKQSHPKDIQFSLSSCSQLPSSKFKSKSSSSFLKLPLGGDHSMSKTWQLCRDMTSKGSSKNRFLNVVQFSMARWQLSFFFILLFHCTFFCVEAPICSSYLQERDSTSFCWKKRPEEFIWLPWFNPRHPWTKAVQHKLHWGRRMHTCSLKSKGVGLLVWFLCQIGYCSSR